MNIKSILNFLKTHWISLTSSVVSLLAIGALVLGMTSKAVTEEMQKVVSGAAEIQSLKGDPKNQEMINAEEERLKKFKDQYEAAIKVAASINERKVLMDGVFPTPRSDEVRYRFQEAYRTRIARLPSEMNAGGPPSVQELQDAADEIADEKRRKGFDEPEPGGGPPKPPAPPIPGQRPEDRPPTGGPTPTGQPIEKAPGLAEEAARRAAIRKALSIQLYAEAYGPRNAFQVSSIATMTEPPAADDMWYAQVGLWIQEDVVRAIREVNEETASKLDPKEANVGRMPIKRLLAIRLPGYVTSTGALIKFEGVRDPGGGGATVPPTPALSNELKQVFTNRIGDENFDLVRFTVVAMVDQRNLLKLPDRLTRVNFYQLVDIDYTTQLPSGAEEAAFHYGDGPVVVVTYEFEGFLARKVYLDLMPEAVQTALGIRPKTN